MEIAWNVDYWHWWILAGVLLLVEVAVSGFFFLWLAVAAGVVGFALYLMPDLGWEYQIIIFSVVSIASIVIFKRYQKRKPPESDQPALNRRGESYVGRTFTLDRPIENGMGELRVDDTTWRIKGPDLPPGTRIRVVGVDGVILEVEAD